MKTETEKELMNLNRTFPVRISEEEWNILHDLAHKNRISKAEVIRRAIFFFAKKENKIKS